MKNKILKTVGFVIVFVFILIVSFLIFSNTRSIDFLQVVESFSDMDTGNIKFKLSKKSNDDTINFIYNFNYNKHFSNEQYKDVFATDGTFGMEIESLEMGLYAPLKITASDDVDLYIEIDESYEDIFGIPGGENVHASLTSIRKNLGIDLEYSELKKDLKLIEKKLEKYFKSINNNFTFYKSEKQGITTGTVGRLGGVISEDNLNDLYDIFKDSLEQEKLEQYRINEIFDYLKDNFKDSSLYIDIYGGLPNKITLMGETDSIIIELSNINNSNTINIPNSSYIELVDYLKEGASEILELFGFEVETTLTKIDYLKSVFADFATYMIACIDYSDNSNFEYADVCINNMNAIINDMKGKIFSEEDISVDNKTYKKYIEFFEEILNYCSLYEESYKDSNVTNESKLQESISKLSEISKELDIDISGVFQE